MLDSFDVLACELMTVVALEGQTMATQRKIAGLLRASPSVAPHISPDGWSERPLRVHESPEGDEFKMEEA